MKLLFGILLGLALLLALAFRSFWYWRQPPPSHEALKERYFEIVAHRGFSAKYPENTMMAFKASEYYADLVELDVHLTADGRVVVIHDATLERTTSGKGEVRAHTWEELKNLDAGSWKSHEYAEARMPLLDEVVAEIAPKQRLLIELKNDADNKPYTGLVTHVLAIIAKYDMQTQCILQSFDPSYLEEIAKLSPETHTMRLIEWAGDPLPWYIDVAFKIGNLPVNPKWKAINTYYPWLTPERVATWKKEGIYTYPYTINTEEDMRRALGMGVAGIITNDVMLAFMLRDSLNDD
jgi:glycerophosphoryl diester phosphodiesterase